MLNRRDMGGAKAFMAVAALVLSPMACGNSAPPSTGNGGGGGGANLDGGRIGSDGSGGDIGGSGGVGGRGGGGVAGSGAAGRGGSGGGGDTGAGAGGGSANGGAPGNGGRSGNGGVGGGGRSGNVGGGGGRSGNGGVGGGGKTTDAGTDAATSGAYVCNFIIGNSTTQQWFDGGFLTHAGIDPTRWELTWVAHHYLDSWANPADAGWTTALDMGHACSRDSTTPDRVIFIATYAPPYPTESTYQTDLTSIVNNIKAKYASVQRIELMTLIRAPGNSGTACSSQANNEQSIPPAEDDAIAAVAADPAFAGLVRALPPAYVPNCADFVADAPQYTTAGATDIAKVYGAYYAAHP